MNGMTILLVDDEADVRDITALLLKKLGFEVLTAGRPDEALAIARSPKDIHLLVTDLSLTGVHTEGEALAESFTEHHPDARILFISGSTEIEMVESRSGPRRAFLGKPFSLDDLRRAISELMK